MFVLIASLMCFHVCFMDCPWHFPRNEKGWETFTLRKNWLTKICITKHLSFRIILKYVFFAVLWVQFSSQPLEKCLKIKHYFGMLISKWLTKYVYLRKLFCGIWNCAFESVIWHFEAVMNGPQICILMKSQCKPFKNFVWS